MKCSVQLTLFCIFIQDGFTRCTSKGFACLCMWIDNTLRVYMYNRTVNRSLWLLNYVNEDQKKLVTTFVK